MSIAVIFPLVTPPFVGKSYSRAFARIDSREIFLRTIELYAPRNQVTQRLVVVQPDDLQTMQERFSAHLGFQGVTVAGGTSDWFGCVERGLARLDADIDLVIIHDPCCPAVPFTLLDAMEDTLAKSKDAAGIVPVLPSRSAFADVEGSKITEYVDMSKVSEVQSPQLFRRKALEAAYAKRGTDPFVDEAELVMTATAAKILTIGGSRFNQRIDNDEMVRLAKDLLEHTPKPKPKTPLNPFGEAEW
jgi:2-C-methyl-D-erythritol 4-phosphate cytidylyltransferase